MMKKIYSAIAASVLSITTLLAAQEPQTISFSKALSLYNNGMYVSAREMFEALSKKAPDAMSEGYAVLCSAQMKTLGYEKAIVSYLNRYPYSPLFAQMHYLRGLDLFDQGNFEQARFEMSQFSSDRLYQGQVAEYSYKRAYCDFKLKNYESARSRFVGVEKMPFSDYTAPSRYAIGFIDYSNSDFDEAIKWFGLSASDPRFAEQASYYILECNFNKKDYSYVCENGPVMYESIPEERKAHLARIISESFLVRGDLDKAKLYYDASLSSDEAKSRSDFFYAGSMLYALKDWQGAVDNYSQMGALTDSLGQIASYHLGDSYLHLKNKVNAMLSFKDAASMSYDPVIQEDAFFNHAKLAFDLNQDGKVFEDYISKYSKSRRGDDIYIYMALSKLVAHDYAGAVEAYDNIDELSPDMRSNYMKANYLRAAQLISMGSFRDAVQFLQASTFYTGKRDPFNQLARYWLAEAYFNSNRYDEAKTILTDLYNGSALFDMEEGRLLAYNLAYCCFGLQDFQNSAKWFDVYLGSNPPMYREDAALRRADSDFYQKDYKNAAAGYRSVIDSYSTAENVYPYLQLGLSYGLGGEKKKKVEALSPVLGKDPSALYWSEAVYELGRAYIAVNNKTEAVNCFNLLQEKTKDNTMLAQALIELGMIARNAKKYDEALALYKRVVLEIPKNEHTEDAMLAIESIYQSKGEPELFLEFVEQLGDGQGRTEEQKEEIYFNSAEQVFLSGNYQKALTSIQKYLEAYPEGQKLADALFYQAECFKSLNQKEAAMDAYARVMNHPSAATLREPSALSYATLAFALAHYADAYKGYRTLDEIARMEGNKLTANAGMMRSAYLSKDYAGAIEASQRVISLSADDNDLIREARMINAKSLIATNERNKAFEILKTLAKEPSTDEGAEANYLIIQDTYDRGDFGKILKMVTDFSPKAGGQNYWLAKAFIVLGDSYAEDDNLEQAKATFESIRTGYQPQGPDDDVLDNVNMRLEKLSQMK